MPGVLRIAAAVAAAGLLLAPAFWNRFPLLEYDTGGYLARWFEGYLVPSRSTVYGLFITALAHPDFWPAVIAQTSATVWILALVLRVYGLGHRPLVLPALTLLLCIGTTLPWLTSILLTDIFAGLAVLALHLLVFKDEALQRWERRALIVLIAFAAATHSATFAVLMALILAAAAVRLALQIGSVLGIARGAAAMALGATMLLGGNLITSGHLAWTPGGIALSFGRMLQDGIVARYLDEHCPDGRLRLCAYRAELPTDADVFFWSGDGSVFNRLGRFAGLSDEMASIVTGSLRAYPAWQAERALVATVRQLLRIDTGEGVVNSIWHTYAIVERYEPRLAADMHAARQQHGAFRFTAINRVHGPVALAGMLLLLAVAALGYRQRAYGDLGALAATVTVALMANAAVCGVFANPHDRYGARLVWVAPLVVLLALARAAAMARIASRAKAFVVPALRPDSATG